MKWCYCPHDDDIHPATHEADCPRISASNLQFQWITRQCCFSVIPCVNSLVIKWVYYFPGTFHMLDTLCDAEVKVNLRLGGTRMRAIQGRLYETQRQCRSARMHSRKNQRTNQLTHANMLVRTQASFQHHCHLWLSKHSDNFPSRIWIVLMRMFTGCWTDYSNVNFLSIFLSLTQLFK